MFILSEMKNVTRIPPELFHLKLNDAIAGELNKKLANKVVLNVGLCIALFDITSLQESFIFPGDGASHTRVSFRYIVFRPFIEEILMGKIRSCSQEGVHVSLGFFDDILIPPTALQHPARFDETEQAWVWEYDTGDGSKHDLFMDAGETIRFRVTAETFQETCPTGPTGPTANLPDSKEPAESKVPYMLTENSKSTFPRKVFSGIQPTGAIHLGNYLGAIMQWVKLQNEENSMTLCIVDLHSMTLPHVPSILSKNIIEMTATLLACGIDPNKVVLFQQSALPQHTEIYWYLGCISTMARLKHLPQFKEKSANLKDIPLGLFVYPVLQAADILTHKATLVPVGEDQLQHLQLTQDLAKMFNSRFGNVFPIPRSLITETAKIKSLRDPSKKMSKSDPDTKSCIYLTDTADIIVKKIKKAVTDFTSQVTFDPENRPGVSNLVTIHAAVSKKSIEDICKEVKDINSGNYKFVVAEAVETHIASIRSRYQELLADPQYLLGVLESGREKAAVDAEKTLNEVKYKLGLQLVNSDLFKEKIVAKV